MSDSELAFELNRCLPFRLLNVTEEISLQFAERIQEAHQFNSDIESRLGPDAMATIWQAVAHLDRLQS